MEYLKMVFTRNNDVSWKNLEDKCVLLNLSSGYYYTLNTVGRFLWESLNGKKKLENICEEIVDLYRIDTETVKKDMIEIIQDNKNGYVFEKEIE